MLKKKRTQMNSAYDILEQVEKIKLKIKNVSYDDFKKDDDIQTIVEHKLMIIAEALTKIELDNLLRVKDDRVYWRLIKDLQDLIKSALKNVGRTVEYEGVGGHLFAFACKRAKEIGFDNIYFEVKTSLIEYYKNKFGAESIMFTNRMFIEGEPFESLISTYFKEV